MGGARDTAKDPFFIFLPKPWWLDFGKRVARVQVATDGLRR